MPFPPGGTADVIARQIAQQAQQASGQSIVIENRPGGHQHRHRSGQPRGA
jgi:tripartite-type tricarboxylate transporter receptor subunit TctC